MHGIGMHGGSRALVVALAVVLTGVFTAALLGGFALVRAAEPAGGSDSAIPGLVLPLPAPSATSVQSAVRTTRPPDRHNRRIRSRSHASASASQPVMVLPATAATPRPSPSPSVRKPAIVVTYLVSSQGPGGFQGEVQVTNNTSQPIANWQIVIALYGDTGTSFTNANAFFSNGVLLLRPATAAQVVPPGGGVLDVFFVAEGTQTEPDACAFDETICG
jgi:Cellulose binding domain